MVIHGASCMHATMAELSITVSLCIVDENIAYFLWSRAFFCMTSLPSTLPIVGTPITFFNKICWCLYFPFLSSYGSVEGSPVRVVNFYVTLLLCSLLDTTYVTFSLWPNIWRFFLSLQVFLCQGHTNCMQHLVCLSKYCLF